MAVKNFNTVLIDLNGNPVPDQSDLNHSDTSKGVSYNPFTMKKITITALMHPQFNEKESAEEKLKNYELSLKISNNNEVDITAEDAVRIKKFVNLSFGPLVIGRMNEFLQM